MASSGHANIPKRRIGGEAHMTKSPRASAWRFTYVAFRNWRNFTNMATTLPQRVFLVGPNASGKSNLLDALRFLRDLVGVGGGLQEAVRRRGGVTSLRSLAARRY
jgi:predicted ATPase